MTIITREELIKKIKHAEGIGEKSITLGHNFIKPGTIIDEDKSVRWNREYIEENNRKYKEELNSRNKDRRILREEILHKDLPEYLHNEFSDVLTTKTCEKLWSRAYEESHSYGIESVLDTFDDLADFTCDILTAQGISLF